MATDHANRQLKSGYMQNKHWNYPDKKKKESPITDEVWKAKDDYFKRTGIRI